MSKRIVYIDRDLARRERYCQALAGAGLKTTGFGSGMAGINHLVIHPASGVILDSGSFEANSPAPSVQRMAREITKADAFVPLILLCERGEVIDAEASAAADGVLQYPLAPERLVEIVTGILSEPLRERVQRKSRYIFAFR